MPVVPQLSSTDSAAKETTCDVLVVGAYSAEGGPKLSSTASELDQELDGYLSELSSSGFKASIGETVVVPTLGKVSPRAIAVVGLGPEDGDVAHAIRRAAGSVIRRLKGYSDVASALHLSAPDTAQAAEVSATSYLLGSYTFSGYKKEPKPSKVQRISFLDAEDRSLERAAAKAAAVNLTRDLINEPPATMTPEILARRAAEMADVAGLKCEVFDKAALTERGFGGILGVSKGSIEEPRLIHLKYVPDGATGRVALVGKGITFDSGGLSLKDAKSMETMKTDMSGAAAVIGVMSSLKRLGVKTEVHALVPSSENMPGGNAIRPGDVITHYGGRTTEVMNTDAEGRLVLADALSYALELDPDAVVDVATLTGAIMVALGMKATGLFSNDDALRDELVKAGEASGERMWPMPMYEDYYSDLESEVADLKNSGARWGGAISAALFLKKSITDDTPWAHLDIAGPARADSDYDEMTKGGSGIAVRTLISWIEGRTA
jgi:leucyl aminopeptidase